MAAAAARSWTSWSGRSWKQEAGGRWSQKDGAAQQGQQRGSGSGNQWKGQWEPMKENTWQSWWSPKPQRKHKGSSGWVDYGRSRSQSQPPEDGKPTQQKEEYITKADAAATVALLKQQIQELGSHPCFDPLRASFFVQLEAAEKKAIDKRTCTQKLLQAEQWLAREQKRMVAEKTKLAELAKWIDEHQERIDKESGLIAGLRAEVGAEPEEADEEMSTTQTELVRLEAKELELRRKRSGANLTEAERAAIDQQADQLLEQVGHKRRKWKTRPQPHMRDKGHNSEGTMRCSPRCRGTSLA
jgi:hypothetical protein